MINITKKLDETINSWLDTKLSELNEVSPGIFIGGVKIKHRNFLYGYLNIIIIYTLVLKKKFIRVF